MTLKKHASICLLICCMSFISLSICINLTEKFGDTKEWMIAALFSSTSLFVITKYIDRKDMQGKGDVEIGTSGFEKITVTTTIWLPLLLTFYAVCALLLMNANFQKVAWILVVLGGNIGIQLAKLRDLVKDPSTPDT